MTKNIELPLVTSARKRTQRVVKCIKEAMLAIEAEIKENEGIYPRNRGRLTMAEVCRRAGVHEITMMGSVHRDTTRPMIMTWIKQLGGIEGAAKIRNEITKRTDVAKEEYRRIASQFQAMYQVEVPRRDDEIRKLKQNVAELEAENIRLQELNTNVRVLQMRPTFNAKK